MKVFDDEFFVESNSGRVYSGGRYERPKRENANKTAALHHRRCSAAIPLSSARDFKQ